MKPLVFMGSSQKNLRRFPKDVRKEAGFAIHLAQEGGNALHAFPLVGFGAADVLEVVINESGDTYRAVYTVRFERAVYVLHAFQKKSKRGKATPRPEMQLIIRRLKAAQQHYEMNFSRQRRKDVSA
jgi:phage-related protein